MTEIVGNLWDYIDDPDVIICITTNGDINSRGEAVMGRGCAFEAKKRFPGVEKELAAMIRMLGNTVVKIRTCCPDPAAGMGAAHGPRLGRCVRCCQTMSGLYPSRERYDR
jgi:hypothetical protein